MSLIILDYQKAYDRLADYKMKCSKNEFINNHIKGIKNFCRYAKCRLAKFKCIKKENFLF